MIVQLEKLLVEMRANLSMGTDQIVLCLLYILQMLIRKE
ncbi:hypothetical protein T11_13031 [Trichinella zimbabwensis]|uniref:Uncharacterized protein n=1 Tax=Trichinella zimbabwensis TaxID=268475 RepID=A0A0V1G7U9_9BILA|nr:hypothetical protein T11_13031 [Trichinella zimbabwensis]